MNKQISMSLFEDELSKAGTSKKAFLAQIERLVPWAEWIGMIEPHYYSGKVGNKPFPIETMLRIYLLQNLYDLADMRVMTEVIDSRAFSEFCGVESSNQVPDGDTIGKFRNILTENGLEERLFAQVYGILEAKRLILKRGTIVDSTLIAAPSSIKNAKKERDPDAKQTKKGNQWYFGYKAHIGVDKDSGLVHHVEVTGANEHDVTVTPKLLHGEEKTVNGDSGYLGADKREDAIKKNKNGKKITYRINKRPSQFARKTGRAAAQTKRREREKSSVRAKVEHVFGVVKNLFKYRKTRYRGLKKQTAKLTVMFTLANLYLSAKRPQAA